MKIANFKHKKTVSSCETASFFYAYNLKKVLLTYVYLSLQVNIVITIVFYKAKFRNLLNFERDNRFCGVIH